MITPVKDSTNKSSLFQSKTKPSCICDSSHGHSNNILNQSMKMVFKDKITQLETRLEESWSNQCVMKDEIKTLKSELLLWVNHWKNLN